MSVGLVYDPVYLEHDTGAHVESAQRLLAVMALLEESGLLGRLESVPARDATEEELTLVHTAEHVQTMRSLAERGGAWVDPDTYVSTGSYRAALRAAGGCLAAADAILEGRVHSAFCLVRPPGHHALASQAMGFCLFNNVAIAARYVQRHRGLSRVAIVDFDIHHGNGTHDSFYHDGSVLYVSVHAYPFYPGTGHWRETGAGEGQGTTVAIPMPTGSGDAEHRLAFSEVIGPVVRRFAPEIILVSAGFDGHFSDPLGYMRLSVDGYGALVGQVRGLADEVCDGRLLLALEGGYDLTALPWCVRRSLEVLLGETPAPDPLGSPADDHVRPQVEEFLGVVKSLHGLDRGSG
jgi:acetoin utilization deacetylase AcuC-like enzyme